MIDGFIYKDFDLFEVSNKKRCNVSKMKKEIESLIKQIEKLKETI